MQLHGGDFSMVLNFQTLSFVENFHANSNITLILSIVLLIIITAGRIKNKSKSRDERKKFNVVTILGIIFICLIIFMDFLTRYLFK